MNENPDMPMSAGEERPGIKDGGDDSLRRYLAGLGLSAILTLMSFWVAGTAAVWAPSLPVLLAALAIGQMGAHLVFFLHLSSAPDQANTILAAAFGVFIVGLVFFGSMIIMASLDDNMMPMEKLIQMQR